MSLPHELFNLNDIFTTHATICRYFGGVQQAIAMRVMRQLGYKPVMVAGRLHWYTADAQAATEYVNKHGIPQATEQDASIKRKQLEQTYGQVGGSQQEMGYVNR